MGFGKDGKGVIITELRSQAIGTLAAATALLIGTKLATVERFRMLKTECNALIFGTIAATEFGGMLLGIADGDLTVAEIEEQIEANGPLGPNDVVLSEQAMRPVFIVGAIDIGPAANNTVIMFRDVQSNAPQIRATPRWTFARTKSWNWFLYNSGEAPTTGASVRVTAKNFGVWVL